MKRAALLLAVIALSGARAAQAGDPCAAAARASPLAASRGRLVVTRDIAAYIVRHAEIACARLDALLRDAAPGHAAVAKARVVQGELETGVLAPIFRLYPDMRDRDQTAADAPGAAVKLGPFGAPPNPRQMGFSTAQHLRWVAGDADRRFLDLVKPIAAASPGARASASEAEKRTQAAAISAIEDITSEIGFVDAPTQRNYPQLWNVTQRELESRMPKQPRTAESDANFRKAAPPPGSVKITAAAAGQMRAFMTELRRQVHRCQVLGLSWALTTRSRGPDDAAWQETGPSLEIGASNCDEIPPDVVRTIDGIRLVISDDKDHHFAGKTVDFVDKRFVVK